MKTPLFFTLLFALMLAARLCHAPILWAEEDLPLAAAREMLAGKMLYRDIWFDKPPLVPAIYLLWGVKTGWVLRAAGALYALLACFVAYRFSRDLWTRTEGLWAAGLMGFFLTFDTPSAVVPLAADSLMLVPHLAAVYLAWRGNAFASGVAAGAAFLFNAKALFVLAACAVFSFPALPLLAAGFALPNAVALGWLWLAGAIPAYVDQVWIWPALYAGSPFLSHPVWNGLVRTLNWAGFHAALLFAWKPAIDRRRLLAWAVVSAAGVTMGWRFFPRYFFQLLPVMVILASRGISMVSRNRKALAFVGILLIPPLARFGPRYAMLAANRQPGWPDIAIDRDSQDAARIVRAIGNPGAALFVWGFRPEIFVYTGLPAATRYLDSQALTGVPADRHLTQSEPVLTSSTHAARMELARSHPDIVVDGLSLFNPQLAMSQYAELREWLSHYREAGRTGTSIVYRRSRE